MDPHSLFRSFFGSSWFHDPFREQFYGEENDEGRESDDIFGPFLSSDRFQKEIERIMEQLEQHIPNGSNLQIQDSSISPNPNDLRQYMLKPGYQSSCQSKPYADIDLDDQVIDPKNLPTSPNPNHSQETRRNSPFSFSARSFSSRTYQTQDGTYVTEKVTRDEQGNEEKTVIYHDSDGKSPDGLDGDMSFFGRIFPSKF